MSRFAVGDRIVSTCGSLYGRMRDIITAIQKRNPDEFTDRDGLDYSVTIYTEQCPQGILCGFSTSQMVKEAEYVEGGFVPCENCCCRAGGHFDGETDEGEGD